MQTESLKEQAAQLGIVEVLSQAISVPSLIPEKEEAKAEPSAEKKWKKQAGGQQAKAEPKKKGKREEHAEKYKNLKSQLKEKQKMEEQLKSLKEERKRKLEEFKQKMKNRRKPGQVREKTTEIAEIPKIEAKVRAFGWESRIRNAVRWRKKKGGTKKIRLGSRLYTKILRLKRRKSLCIDWTRANSIKYIHIKHR